MIYLMESGEYYKIGYAKDVEKRMKAYNTHNPNYKLIDVMEGTKSDEAALHELCGEYQDKLEWFTKVPEILIIWKIYKKNAQLTQKIYKNNIQLIQKKNQEISNDIKYLKNQIEPLSKQIQEQSENFNLAVETLQKYYLFINNLYNGLIQDISPKEIFETMISDFKQVGCVNEKELAKINKRLDEWILKITSE